MARTSRRCSVGSVHYATMRVKGGMAGLAEGELESVARGSPLCVSGRGDDIWAVPFRLRLMGGRSWNGVPLKGVIRGLLARRGDVRENPWRASHRGDW